MDSKLKEAVERLRRYADKIDSPSNAFAADRVFATAIRTVLAALPAEGAAVPTKRYTDGSVGDYHCICALCGAQFVGHKRDVICPRHDSPESTPPAAQAEPVKREWPTCRGVSDSRCQYMALCGLSCNKCGRVHDGRHPLDPPAAGTGAQGADERAAFETWARAKFPGTEVLCRQELMGSYLNHRLDLAWLGWSARAALSKESK